MATYETTSDAHSGNVNNGSFYTGSAANLLVVAEVTETSKRIAGAVFDVDIPTDTDDIEVLTATVTLKTDEASPADKYDDISCDIYLERAWRDSFADWRCRSFPAAWSALNATTINGAISESAMSLLLTSPTGWPTSDFYATLRVDTASCEVIRCTSLSGSTVTIAERGCFGTTAIAHPDLAAIQVFNDDVFGRLRSANPQRRTTASTNWQFQDAGSNAERSSGSIVAAVQEVVDLAVADGTAVERLCVLFLPEHTQASGDDKDGSFWSLDATDPDAEPPELNLTWQVVGGGPALTGDVTGQATVEGTLSLDTDISGDLTGAGTVDGALSAERALVGDVQGAGLIAAVRVFSVGDSWALLSTHHGGSQTAYGEAIGDSYTPLGVLRDRLAARGLAIPAVERYAVAGSTSADWAAQDNTLLLDALAGSDLPPVVLLSLGANDLAVDYGDVYDLADHPSWAPAVAAIDAAIRSLLDDLIAARPDIQILFPSYSNWAIGDIFSIPIPCQNFLANAFTATDLADVTEQNINEICQDYLQPVYDDIGVDYAANVRIWDMWQALPLEPGGERWRGTDYDLVVNCIHLNEDGFAAWWDVMLDDLAAEQALFFADPRLHNLSIDPAWTGDLTGAATTEGVLAALRALTGDVTGAATVEGVLTSAGLLVGASDGTATVEGVLVAARQLVGAVSGQATVEGDVTIQADVTLVGDVVGAATAEGTLVALRALLGAAAGAATVDGLLTAAGLLLGDVAGQASAEGALSAIRLIAGQVSGTATVEGALISSPLLSGDVTGQATVEGVLIALRALTGAVSGVATTEGALTGSAEITGDVTGQASAEGALSAIRLILGDVAGTADAAGVLTAILDLTGDVTGAGAAEASLTAARALIGSVTGAATIEGTVTTEQAQVLLSGAVDGLAVAEAEAIATRALTGDLTGTGVAAAALTVVDRDLHIRSARILAPRPRGRLLPP